MDSHTPCHQEDSLLQIRDWLIQGVAQNWHRVEIFIRDENLRNQLANKCPFPSDMAVIAEDIHSLSRDSMMCSSWQMHRFVGSSGVFAVGHVQLSVATPSTKTKEAPPSADQHPQLIIN
ncbi:adenine nucleotide alpha hydrolases-likesuperfamily protein [Striga asiatica]|uniref:Adenine nucleotide alpha hydrolases-likesuperfamily protein n=1 Tax=Striga asiatica TaxID=4170 RepID=A0A5A7P4Z6_STRAF|nr:adenine nucleotide alpha hydrolases-likesuperfamily protein [Striga asiatica]